MATRTCASPVYDEVNNAVNGVVTAGHTTWNTAAVDGDTVVIPAGTATWTTTLSVTRAITLQGAGIGATIIRDGLTSGWIMGWTLVATKLSRLTGIEFQDAGAPTRLIVFIVSGSNTDGSNFRWDHCKWNALKGQIWLNSVIGVVDHNTFINGFVGESLVVFHGTNWDGGVNGDKSWSAATGFGGSQWTFLEDNDFSTQGGPFNPITDGYEGARFVMRYNTIHDGYVGGHGTESSGRGRGTRAMELYNNNFVGTLKNVFCGGTRSGGVLYHHNDITGYVFPPVCSLTNYRHLQQFVPWGGADGVNPWDHNNATGVFFTGTTAGTSVISSSSCTVQIAGGAGLGWTANQWNGYTLRRLTNLGGVTGTTIFSYIVGNTSSTDATPNRITYQVTVGGPFETPMSFATGDSVEIRKVDLALDQTGAGQGDLLTDISHAVTFTGGSANITWNSHGLTVGTPMRFTTDNTLPGGVNQTHIYYVLSVTTNTFQVADQAQHGAVFVPSTSGTGNQTAIVTVNSAVGGGTGAAWPRQALEPAYSWGNRVRDHGDINSNITSGQGCLEGTHYFNGIAMPGYAPYVYPHPLVSGQVGVPPVVTSALSASGTVGVAFSYQILATNTPTSYGATPLPSGLSINSATGLLSGTPTTAGIYSITISAVNAFGTGTAVLTLTVQTVVVTQFPPVISSPTSAFGIQNTAFTYQITATHSPTSYSASPLPAGLAVNSGTGLISGAPTAVAVTNVTIGATNADGTGTAVLVLTITATAPTPVGRHPKKWRNTLLRRRNIR